MLPKAYYLFLLLDGVNSALASTSLQNVCVVKFYCFPMIPSLPIDSPDHRGAGS